MNKQKLEWNDEYSVKVKEIDDQHKKLIDTINRLIEIMEDTPTPKEVDEIIASLVEYKKVHFATEEKYFDEFNYSGKNEHKEKHKMFNGKLNTIIINNKDDSMNLAYELIDFLEDWLIDHLIVEDQKYVACFQEHGLK